MLNSSRRAMTIFAVVFFGLVCSSSARADQVDNPAYLSWAKQKVGTSVTFNVQMTGAPVQAQTTIYTLKEIVPDKVTVLRETKADVGGTIGQPVPPQTLSYPAKVEKGLENGPPNFTGTVKESGKETIEANGKKYDCRVFEVSGQSTATSNRGVATQRNTTGKIWRNEVQRGFVLAAYTSAALCFAAR